MSRKLDLSQFRGDDSDDDSGFASKRALALDDKKSKTFNHGITKKSKKDLEKAAEEKKRVEEEAMAKLVMAEYEEAFDRPAVSSTTALSAMRGGFGGGGFGGGSGGSFVRAGGGGPVAPVAPMPGQAPIPYQPPKGPAAMGYSRLRPQAPKEPSPPPSAGAKPKGKRAMDHFLQEIKSNQEARETRLGKVAKRLSFVWSDKVSGLTILQSKGPLCLPLQVCTRHLSTANSMSWSCELIGRPRIAWETEKGGCIVSDQESTNLFISNLPSNITEESLGLFFAKLGPIGTVKIMWPRGEEASSIGATISSTRRNKAGLQGFVSYMKRKDAEKAVAELDGLDWGGSVLRVGWSKSVPMPQKALYDLGGPSSSRAGRVRSLSPSPPRTRKRSRSRSDSPRHRHRSDSYSSSSRSPSPKKETAQDKWLAKVPPEQEKFIRAVAERVREYGKGFEEVLREREKENAKFLFLFKEELPEYHLYKLACESRYRVPTPPPDDFDDEGYASIYSSDSAEDSEKERTTKGKLGKLARRRFEAMLRVMSGRRVEIARAMEFALSNAEAADEVADVVCRSLRLDGTPVPRKIARLHLVSDILHNSASPLPNVWKYRLAYEQRLAPVFVHLAGVCNSLQAYFGRISAEVFKAQVGAILDIWERWIVFTQDVNGNLRDLFNGSRTLKEDLNAEAKPEKVVRKVKEEEKPPPPSVFKTSGFKSSFKPVTVSSASDDLDGEAMDEDLDGEAMDADLDGEAMDLDGEAMDEDLDGEAIS